MAEQALYEVVGAPIFHQVDGFETLEPPGDTSLAPALTLTRTTDDNDTAVYFSLSSIEDEYGNEFPRDMLLVKTWYDSDWKAFTSQSGRWMSFDEQVLLLKAGETSSEIHFALRGTVDAWAGTYKGSLSSDKGPDIPIEIVVENSIVVVVDPEKMSVAVDHGPGQYKLAPVEVTITANGDWEIVLSSSGLLYTGKVYNDVSPLELFYLFDSDEMTSLKEGHTITGSGSSITTLSLALRTETISQYPAGIYEGAIIVSVYNK